MMVGDNKKSLTFDLERRCRLLLRPEVHTLLLRICPIQTSEMHRKKYEYSNVCDIYIVLDF